MAIGTMEKVTPVYGSNANGSYIKFPEGTMIQWGTKKVTTAFGASGSVVTNGYRGFDSGSFPLSFIATPYAVATIGDSAEYWVSSIKATSSSAYTAYIVGNVNNTEKDVNWIAIGRWK